MCQRIRARALAEMADIIKVEMQLTTEEQRTELDKAVRAIVLPHAGGENRDA